MKRVTAILLFIFLFLKLSAQWVPVSPVNECALVLAEKGDKLFAGAYGGLYQSTNDGASWQKVKSKTPPYFYNINDKISRIFVTDSSLTIFSNDFIYKSKDDGITWEKLYSSTFYDLLDVKGNEMIASKFNDFYKTEDGGKSWVKIPNTFSNNGSIISPKMILNKNKYYYLFEGKIYTSINKGASWDSLSFIKNATDILSYQDTIYGITEKSVIYSFDNGNSWITKDIPATPISISIKNGRTLYVTTDLGIYKTTSGGSSWEKLPEDKTIFWSFGFLNRDTKILINKKGTLLTPSAFGVSRSSNDGQYWLPCINDVFRTQGCGNIFNLNRNLIAVFIHSAIYPSTLAKSCLSEDKGNTWAGNYSFFGISDLIISKDKIIVVDGLNIFSSINNGKTWVTTYNDSLKNPYILSYYDNNLFLIANLSIYHSDDLGEHWKKTSPISNTIPNLITTTSKATFCAEIGLDNVYKTTDNGKTWLKLNTTFKDVRKLYSFDNNIIIATLSDIFLSTDDGQIWRSIKNNLPNTSIDYTFLYYKSRLLLCGYGLPVHISNPEFTSWTEIESSGYNLYYNQSMTIIEDELFLAEGNLGVFKRNLNEILLLNSVGLDTPQPILYPNPTKDILFFKNTIVKNVKVYTAAGLLVKEAILSNNNIDIQSLSSGIYTIELDTNSGKKILKFTKIE